MDFQISAQTKGFLLAKQHLKQLDNILYTLISSEDEADEELQDRIDKPLIELRKMLDELVINSINDHFDDVSFCGQI